MRSNMRVSGRGALPAGASRLALGLGTGLALLAAACSPMPGEGAAVAAATPATHAASGLDVIPLTATTRKGRPHTFRVEVARTSQQQARGLMQRKKMGADEGMIFPNDPPQLRSFWMHDTILPLDIIFIGPDHKVVNIAANSVPYSETPIPSLGPVIAVLELNAGRAAQLGIEPGSMVTW